MFLVADLAFRAVWGLACLFVLPDCAGCWGCLFFVIARASCDVSFCLFFLCPLWIVYGFMRSFLCLVFWVEVLVVFCLAYGLWEWIRSNF